MGGHEVVVAEIRQRGEDAIEIGEATKKIELSDPVAAVAAALPGTVETPGEARSLAAHWDDELFGLGKRVSTYGDSMVSAAQRYEADDEAAATDLRQAGHNYGVPQ